MLISLFAINVIIIKRNLLLSFFKANWNLYVYLDFVFFLNIDKIISDWQKISKMYYKIFHTSKLLIKINVYIYVHITEICQTYYSVIKFMKSDILTYLDKTILVISI